MAGGGVRLFFDLGSTTIPTENTRAIEPRGRCWSAGINLLRGSHIPSTRRISVNARYPINALSGIVMNHAVTIRRATPHFTALTLEWPQRP